MIIMYIILIVLGAIFYRMGGSDKYDTKWRDLGVPAVSLLSMYLLGRWHWSLFICFPLMFGAMTTYWKVLNRFFHKPKTDSYWFNWFAHGLMIGLSFLPYAYFTDRWIMVIARALALSFLIMIWSEVNDNAVWEECGRGALIVGTLWLI